MFERLPYEYEYTSAVNAAAVIVFTAVVMSGLRDCPEFRVREQVRTALCATYYCYCCVLITGRMAYFQAR